MSPPKRGWRLAVAVAIATIAIGFVIRLAVVMPHYGTDFDPIRFAARLTLHGDDPYLLIGPRKQYFWNFPLLYPLPAIIIGIPFVATPLVAARALFVGLTSGALAYVISRNSWWPLLVFASSSWMHAVSLAQWSPALLLAWHAPLFGFLLAAKPNIGLPVLAGARTRRSFVVMTLGIVAITCVSFAVLPGWVPSWIGAFHGQQHIRSLILMPLGVPMILASARWRRPEARLLLMLALVPQNPALYEGVLLFAVPQRGRDALILATLSWFVEPIVTALGPTSTFADAAAHTGLAMLLCMYLPALVMVFVRKNEGDAPRFVESLVRRLPDWLRGIPTHSPSTVVAD